MYVYKRTEFSPYELYTVGFYDPDGKWQPESDHETAEEAAKRINYLNGNGSDVKKEVRISWIKSNGVWVFNKEVGGKVVSSYAYTPEEFDVNDKQDLTDTICEYLGWLSDGDIE